MPAEPLHPVSRRTKCLLWTGLILLPCLVAGWFWFRDEPLLKPEGIFVRPESRDIPPENNGLFFLSDALNRQDLTPGDWILQEKILKSAAPWDQAVMQPLVDAAPAVKRLMDEAMARPDWQESPSPEYRNQSLKNLFRILKATSQSLARQGHAAEARRWLADASAFGFRYLEHTDYAVSTYDIISQLNLIQNQAFQQLGEGPAMAEDLVETQRLLQVPVLDRNRFRQLVARQFWHQKDVRNNPVSFPNGKIDPVMMLPYCCDGTRPPKWWIRGHYKPRAEQNLQLLFHQSLSRVGFLEGPAGRNAVAELRQTLEPMTEFSFTSTDPNHTGRLLASRQALEMLDFESSYFALEAMRRCRLAAIAAKGWSLNHAGTLPASLTDLVPDYLPAVPLDPYDGNPVRWDQPGGTAYVIGEDGVADLPIIPPGKFSVMRKEGSAAGLP